MGTYPFDIIPSGGKSPLEDKTWLTKRPFIQNRRSLEKDAPNFFAGSALADAINTAIAVGDPLLLTGEPGTGKTQAAYYAAWQIGVGCIHFQVKSDSTARDLLYDFDMVRYFRDANLKTREQDSCETPDKSPYVEKRALWEAFETAEKQGLPQVLLIDEIDKAPRDFPNDLLHELDQMYFTIIETGKRIEAPIHLRPIVFITSNSERRLPEPFLRRCVYHHIEFDSQIVQTAVDTRRNDFKALSDDFLKLAIRRFLSLRGLPLRKQPATGELLAWLRVLSLTTGKHHQQLEEDLSKLPHLGVLLKDHDDLKELRK